MSTKRATHVGGVILPNPFAGILALPFMFGKDRALCADHDDPELWHPTTAMDRRRDEREAIRICRRCPLIDGCRRWAIEHGEHGIWGGLTEHKRTRIRNGKVAA